MSNWQQIDSAPRDGRELLLAVRVAHGYVLRVGWWEAGEPVYQDEDEPLAVVVGDPGWTDGYARIDPEFWSVLPDAPFAASAEHLAQPADKGL